MWAPEEGVNYTDSKLSLLELCTLIQLPLEACHSKTPGLTIFPQTVSQSQENKSKAPQLLETVCLSQPVISVTLISQAHSIQKLDLITTWGYAKALPICEYSNR